MQKSVLAVGCQWLNIVGLVIGMCFALSSPSLAGDEHSAQLTQAIDEYFAQRVGYQDGDLITREDVAPLLEQLTHAGWSIRDRDAFLDRMLAKSDPLVSQFQSPRGRQFLDQIRNVPGGIDRVDRLLRMPHGQANVRDLIHKLPNGHKIVEELVNSSHGKRLSKTIAKTGPGRQFTEPTQRIYTVRELKEALPSQATFTGRRRQQP